MKLFKDNIPPPAGITPEEWEERKRKLKRKAWKQLILLMVSTVLLGEFLVWLGGGYESVQPRHLEELQVRSGVCSYQTRRNGAHEGIADKATGDRILLDKVLVPSSTIKKEQNGLPATIWYYVGQAKQKYVYQIKVDGELQLDIETANQVVEKFNERAKEDNLIMRMGWNLFFLVVWPFVIRMKHWRWLLDQK
jgi:hypothetical protein